MNVKRIVKEGITRPFGDERTVKQAFPSAIPAEQADPFLMCDYFNMENDASIEYGDDDFPVGWHPHRGFDIASYIKTGVGRHGDSLGNRETFSTPGMQWMSTGSGVEHAEGGGGGGGGKMQGFQIWINVPSDRKMDDPRYGTVPTEELPVQEIAPGVTARVLAGAAFNDASTGPFETVQPVQMVDFELECNSQVTFNVAEGLDTTLLYLYEGTLTGVNEQDNDAASSIPRGSVIQLDATSDDARHVQLKTSDGAKVIMFAGKKLNEPIAWHGPIVMNTQEQIRQTFTELRSGKFPPVRVDWDYKRIASKPKVVVE